jgi:hypothetical protein
MISNNLFQDFFTKKILLSGLFLFVLASITLDTLTINLALGQIIDQNVTSLNIVEPNNTLNTEEGNETVIETNSYIVKLKQPSQIFSSEKFILQDHISSIIKDLEDQGFKVNESRLVSNLNLLALTIDSPEIFTKTSSPSITNSSKSSNTTDNQSSEKIINIIEENPLVEDVENNKLVVLH